MRFLRILVMILGMVVLTTILAVAIAIEQFQAVMAVVLLVTTIWATYSASAIELHKFKVHGPTDAGVTFIGCMFLWSITIPWYVYNRGRVLRGEAELKPKYRESTLPPSLPPGIPSANQHLAQNSVLDELEKLASLRDQGILSESEFALQKQIALNAPRTPSTGPVVTTTAPVTGIRSPAKQTSLLGCLAQIVIGTFLVVGVVFVLIIGAAAFEEYTKQRAIAAEPGRQAYNNLEANAREYMGFFKILLEEANRNLIDVTTELESGPFESPQQANYSEDEYERIEVGMQFFDVAVLIGGDIPNYGTLRAMDEDAVVRSWTGFASNELVVTFDKTSGTVVSKRLIPLEDAPPAN